MRTQFYQNLAKQLITLKEAGTYKYE